MSEKQQEESQPIQEAILVNEPRGNQLVATVLILLIILLIVSVGCTYFRLVGANPKGGIIDLVISNSPPSAGP